MNIIPKRNVYLAAVNSTKLRTVSMKSPFSVFVAYVQHGYYLLFYKITDRILYIYTYVCVYIYI